MGCDFLFFGLVLMHWRVRCPMDYSLTSFMGVGGLFTRTKLRRKTIRHRYCCWCGFSY